MGDDAKLTAVLMVERFGPEEALRRGRLAATVGADLPFWRRVLAALERLVPVN